MTAWDGFAAACQREDEWGLLAATMACQQPYRFVPILQLVHEDSFQDRATRALWAAIRAWWEKYKRLPTPEELYRATSSEPDVEKAGGWVWLEHVLSSQPNSGALEELAWHVVTRSKCYAVYLLLVQAAKKLERVRPEQAAVLLDRIAAEARQASASIRQLSKHNAAWRENMLRYTEEIVRRISHGRPRSRA